MDVDTSIFKAYDIRGIYPDTLNNEVAYKIAQGYVNYVKPKGEVLVGHDVRIHSEELKEDVIRGLTDAGVNVVDVGLISTDMYYFSVGNYKLSGGIQVTASHNPPQWHGMKMVREQVKPLTLEKGINQIKEFVVKNNSYKKNKHGKVRKLNIEEDYANYILSWLTKSKLNNFKIVYNPNFGYAGKIFEKIVSIGNLPFEIIPLNAEPDGSFPKGRPDPFVPENRPEFIELVKSTNSDFGVAWDADADRAFFCANGGLFIEPYFLNTILIKKMLMKYPNEKIIYDPRYTWALIDTIKNNDGKPVVCRVGHSYIKEKMRSENALFATESSGHTYYRYFWYADSGMIPVMQVAEYLSENNITLEDAVKEVMNNYFISGEINTKVKDAKTKMEEISEKYKDAKQSRLDGISIEYTDFRFTVRPSNTEPLLRLTLEAKSKELMESKRDEVLEVIRS
jgi:phosphomannomutase